MFNSEKNGLFGVDIGGTLCKICFYEPDSNHSDSIRKLVDFITRSAKYGSTGVRDENLAVKCDCQGRFHFIMFETRRMEQAFKLISEAQLFPSGSGVQCAVTGGGSHKYGGLFDQFGMKSRRKVDEMKALVTGLNYLLTHLTDECFYYLASELESPPLRPVDSSNDSPKRQYIDLTSDESPFPYILVNIGTGVSILKVDGDGSYERISGSGLGGGSYWGLARLLTQAKSFDDSLQLSSRGKTKNVDMTVGDIYGGDYASLGLPADMTASFFAKFISRDDEHLRDNVSDADICRGLLLMTTNNIGQIAFLLAKLHNVKQILFSGSFLRHSSHVDVASIALSKAIAFWSNNEMRALFLRHEGYFGALGALITSEDGS